MREVGPRSDVDLLLVGTIGFVEAVRALQEAQWTIGQEIDPVVLSSTGFKRKVKDRDILLAEVMAREKRCLMGSENELGKPVGNPAPGST